MKRHILFASVLLASTSAFAQSGNVSGVVVDKMGNPVSGALVEIQNNKFIKAYTDKNGAFEIGASANDELVIDAPDQSKKTVALNGSKEIKVVMDYASRPVELGFGIKQNVGESTVSVASASNDEFNKRSSKNIGNSLLSGSVLGLTALQGTGDYASYEPSFYVRGLQSLNGSSPLILVDGIERNITYLSPEEVENVYVLKDAAATALYGYKGANGVVNIVTKRGKYKTNEIKFTYDHAFNWEARRPKFVNAYDYAVGLNEAYANDGKSPRYSDAELGNFKSGEFPYLYPNVDWINETFKNNGSSDIYNLTFRGGGERLRYYTNVNLISNLGFIAHPKENSGYSTQNKYSKGSIRTNLDIDLTSTTKLMANISGTLMEASRPGLSSDDLWGKIYTVPAAAFPVKTEAGLWGGNTTWTGYYNPVALTEGRAYSKAHTRSLFADMTLSQDLSAVTDGLSVWTRFAYDNIAAYWENHTREYKYGMDTATEWKDGKPTAFSHYTGGKDGTMSEDSKLDWQNRNFNFGIGANYDHTFGDHSISSVLMWNYEFRNWNGQNNTQYRTTATLYNHYGYKERYLADVSLSLATSNKLAPGHRTNFSPTLSAAWVLSKENFMQNVSFIDFLKLRASWGIINLDYIPAEGYWNQTFGGGNSYFVGKDNATSSGGWSEGRLASTNVMAERATKYNVGMDATVLVGLNLTVDGYYQRRDRQWVNAGGKVSSVLGASNRYINGGIVDSWGVELGANYAKEIAKDLKLTAGVNYTLAKNEIKEEYEEPRAYDYLKRTGNPVGQIFGLQAVGFFKDQADIDHSPAQQFAQCKPGDIKYKDQNGDGIINGDDVVKMGYNTTCPEIYYSFNLGLEYKGLGFTATFQGAANYSAYLDTQSMYRPLVNNTNIGQYYFDNRWTSATAETAKFPRLSAETNDNNNRYNSIWLADRSFLKLRNVEVYYNFPKSLLGATKFINNAKLYVRGVDLLCFDHIKELDPECYGATYPVNRSVSLGLVLGF